MSQMILLDHLTLADAPPLALIDAAAGAGFDGVGLFLHRMPEVPGMADFDLVADHPGRRACRRAARDAGCAIGIAYPCTIGRTTADGDHDRVLDAAAELGAGAVNLLVFDRQEPRRVDSVSAFCAAADGRGLAVGLEFFPPSAVATLDDALALLDAVGMANLKLTIDLLHVARSGGSLALLERHRHHILLAQLCDAPATPPEDPFAEASGARLLPGQGELDIAGFLDACGGVMLSVEAPGQDRSLSHADRATQARRAIDRVTCAVNDTPSLRRPA